MFKDRPKLTKIANLLLQSSIFAITWIFIWNHAISRGGIERITGSLAGREDENHHNLALALVVVLMAVNWTLEAAKWRYLIGRIERISLGRAILAVITGVSVSLFTPNRVGEYLGRVFILNQASRIEGILITIVGSMSQLLVTFLYGSAALLLFIPRYMSSIMADRGYLYPAIAVPLVVLNILLLGLYFNLSFLTSFKERVLSKGLQRIRRFFRVFAFYHNRELATVLAYSLSRYIVFSFQYFLLLRIFGVEVPLHEAMVLVALIYLVMTLIPSVALSELGIRGSVAIYFFSFWAEKTNPGTDSFSTGVLAASLLLWFVNLGVPAVAGTFFIFRLRFFRKEKPGDTIPDMNSGEAT